MTSATRTGALDAHQVERICMPRQALVTEGEPTVELHADGTATYDFDFVEGPFRSYHRSVLVRPDNNGATKVEQKVTFKVASPYFGRLFVFPLRHELSKLSPHVKSPFWAPDAILDARASASLGALALLGLLTGYQGTLLTQTISFAGDELGVGTNGQARALAFARVDVAIAITVAWLGDRYGRKRVLRLALTAACLLSSLGAFAPSIAGLVALQVPSRGLLAASGVLIAVLAMEEVPATARAWATSVLALAAAMGPGLCVALLFVADLGESAWRLLYLLPLAFTPFVLRACRHIGESRRFVRTHARIKGFAGHGGRLALLCSASVLAAIYTTPASQLRNEFLRDERAWSGATISLFVLGTATPGGLGVLAGGLLADRVGRKIVGAIGLIGGSTATTLSFIANGPSMWIAALVGALMFGATVPALSVYGAELFPTAMRGKANGALVATARIGSVIGLLTVGQLSDTRSIGFGLAVCMLGPLMLAGIVLLFFPETAGEELEALNPEDANQPTPPPAMPFIT
jgi:MFS family permease